MAKQGVETILVASTGRLKTPSYVQDAVNEATQKLNRLNRSVIHVDVGAPRPFGPLGNETVNVTITWQENEPEPKHIPIVATPTPAPVVPSPFASTAVRQTNTSANNLEAALKRGNMCLEDEEWAQAEAYFNAVLDIEPENANAYLGLLLAEFRVSDIEKLSTLCISISNNKYYKRALRYADESLATTLQTLADIATKAKNERALKNQRARELKQFIDFCLTPGITAAILSDGSVVWDYDHVGIYKETVRQTNGIPASERYKYVSSLRNHLYLSSNYAKLTKTALNNVVSVKIASGCNIGITPNETLAVDDKSNQFGFPLTSLAPRIAHDIQLCNGRVKEIGFGDGFAMALLEDGTIKVEGIAKLILPQPPLSSQKIRHIATGRMWQDAYLLYEDGTVFRAKCAKPLGSLYEDINADDLTDILSLEAGSRHILALRADGTVVARGNNEHGQCNVSEWRDIIDIAAIYTTSFGLKADGTVVRAGGNGTPMEYDTTDLASIVACSTPYNSTHYAVGIARDGTIHMPKGITSPLNGQHVPESEAALRATLEENQRREEAERAEKQRRKEAAAKEARIAEAKKAVEELDNRKSQLNTERESLQAELPTIKGLFAESRKSKITKRLTEIDSEISSLEAQRQEKLAIIEANQNA